MLSDAERQRTKDRFGADDAQVERDYLISHVLTAISDELGDRARDSLSASIDRIRQFPELYASLYGKIRAVPIREFPFILSYVFEFDRVVVLGLVHSSVPHETWNRRDKPSR